MLRHSVNDCFRRSMNFQKLCAWADLKSYETIWLCSCSRITDWTSFKGLKLKLRAEGERMSDYFRSPKHLLGICTLAVACLLTIGWVRSRETVDSVEIYPGPFAHYQWDSFDGTLSWQSSDHGKIIPRWRQWRFDWNSTPIESEDSFEVGSPRTSSWMWKVFGVDVRWQQQPRHAECYVRYCSIIIPLIGFSAYLLLEKSKPTATVSREE